MGYRIYKFIACALLCTPLIARADGGIQVRIDQTGKKVFYNIPTKHHFIGSDGLESVALYYSNQAANYLTLIQDICGQYGVDAQLVKALIQVESNYNERALSPKGAMGLMQLMPGTASRYGVQQAFDPRQNIEGGVKYLKDLSQLFNSDFRLVLAAYNAGENVVQRLNDIPNYTETQNYVRKILALYNGDSSFTPFAGGSRPRLVSYFKYVDDKGVTHYSAAPIDGVQLTKVSFYY
jgi:Transglycosylase SLT domain/Domain of unknown function (DUF4124)